MDRHPATPYRVPACRQPATFRRSGALLLIALLTAAGCSPTAHDGVRIWVRNDTVNRVFVVAIDLLVYVDAAPGSLGIAFAGDGPVESTLSVVGKSCVEIGDVPVSADQGDVIVRVVGETVEVGNARLFELPSDGRILPKASDFSCPP